jgi:hypothetical protein
MAYFANGSEGEVFEEQCSGCKYGERQCPIYFVQAEFNYEVCNNKGARKILDYLVDNNGTCVMYKEFKTDFAIDKNQIKMFSYDSNEKSKKG